MNKVYFSTALFLPIFAVSGFASQINRIPLSELHSKSDLIVMAEVTEVAKEDNQDHVTIQVDSYLKGSNPQKIYTFTLITRGGLKDFDPSLKQGDTGVFFLKRKEQKGQVEKAYWGSIAIFQKNHFCFTEEKTQTPASITTSKIHPDHSAVIDLSTYLDIWRSYRVKRQQIRNIDEYERGFRKGFTSQPGLVDGSADFNLGHSDGMLAKMKMFPNKKDVGDSN
ncbi:MAG: hypothetical protein PVG87_13260 [Desulfobacteraceae bacterium]|jgi:hypothetical protein